MSVQGSFKRWLLLIENLQNRQYPSKKILNDYLFQHGFEVSERTVDRDIEKIRNEFGIEIKYYSLQKGYCIDEEETINMDSFLRFIEIVGTADLISESIKDSRDTLNYISFESQGNLNGIDNLKSLLFAVRKHRIIKFKHENFTTGKKRNYSVKPYMLREYQNRWYVVGTFSGSDEFRTFGIDRIEDLRVSTGTFIPDAKSDPIELFENVVGLVYSINKLEEVILSFTPFQAKYVNSLPLHKSQKIISESKNEVIIKLSVIPNFELKQKILMLCDQVKVLKPKWFADDIKKTLKNTLKNY